MRGGGYCEIQKPPLLHGEPKSELLQAAADREELQERVCGVGGVL